LSCRHLLWRIRKVGEYIDPDDGTVFEVYDSKDKWVVFWYEKNGKSGVFYISKDSNPNPDDSGKGIGKPNVEQLLKNANYKVHKNAENTPLGGILNKQGKGFNPRGNPGDDTSHDKGPSAPYDGAADYKKSAKQLAEEQRLMNMGARARNNMKGGMYDGSEGGGEAPPGPGNHGKGKKGSGDDSSSYKDHQNNTVGNTYDLGPRPDLINPNPEGPTNRKVSAPGKTGASK
jgi:hypothetical protein